MRLSTLEAVVRALDESRVRFILVGGLAVVAHGYGRSTQDVDLVVDLEGGNILRAFDALTSLGYRPRVPVTAAGLADRGQRERWIREKGMTVLNFHSDLHRDTPVDVFVTEPFDFDREYNSAVILEISPGREVHVVSLETLLQMKDAAGRPQDAADAHELRQIHGDTHEQ
jgi:hypothetical protein